VFVCKKYVFYSESFLPLVKTRSVLTGAPLWGTASEGEAFAWEKYSVGNLWFPTGRRSLPVFPSETFPWSSSAPRLWRTGSEHVVFESFASEGEAFEGHSIKDMNLTLLNS
jgi:hypothetical protein